MRVTLLGTGCPPPNPRRRGPAALVAQGEVRVLVDTGSGVAARLIEAGVRIFDLERVCLTHLHSDHVIDLGHVVLSRWIIGQDRPLEVYGPAGARAHVEKLLALWEWDVEVRRAHMHDREPPRVEVTEIEEGRVFSGGGLTVTAFAVEHEPVKPAFGFVVEGGGRRVVISGDTRPCENLIRHARSADVLIHECTDATKAAWSPGCGWPSREAKVRDLASYHTGPDEVGKVAARATAATLVLTHLMPGSDPADLSARAARDFSGKIVVGEDVMEV
ncbi:MAG: MBL fold metallo-hydrolase [Candidatus Rokubacteria bacterium]|nr:MBL fold metallo-hydrolase [Candidatus Rokubacteria bacterium]